MKTKAQIVQELLDEKKITAEDAVVLLMRDAHYIPYYAGRPYNPYPTYPTWPIVTVSTASSGTANLTPANTFTLANN
jgi:hypothetical protein